MSLFSMAYLPQIAEMLTTALAHFVWQGTALALMLFVAVKLFGIESVHTRYILSVATILMMGLALVLTIMWHRHNLDSFHSTRLSGASTIALAQNLDFVSANSTDTIKPSALLHRPDVQFAVMVAWLAGVLILSIRLFAGFGITLWVRASVKPVSDQIQEMSCRLGKRMGVAIRKRVFASMRIGQAIAIGFFRPVVLIPAAWLTQLSPEMLEAIIAHELAHIRRWDLWVNLVQRFIETLLFYHPAVWWLSHRIRLEREMCCDEIAADCLDRAVYVRSLESVARMARGNLLLATSIQGGMQMKLLTRIRHLLGTAPVDVGNWGAAGFVAMIFPVAAAIALFVTGGTSDSAAVADDKNDDKISGAIDITLTAKDEKPNDAQKVSLKWGDQVGVKISGNLGVEFLRLMAPNKEFKTGFEEFFIGRVTMMLPDGNCQIEYSNGVDRGDKAPQLFTMTAVVQTSQIKMPPDKLSVYAWAIDAKADAEKVIAEHRAKQDPRLVDAAKFNSIKRDYFYVELSDPKGVKFKLWELKREVGD